MFKKGFWVLAVILITGILALTGCSKSSGGSDSGKTEITYWQYTFDSKVKEINKLIEKFEKENPDIKVTAQDFPYDQYNDKLAAAMHAGKGPDIVNLYYGWIPDYVKQDFIQPIPEDFMSNQEIEDYYIPMIQSQKMDDKYYTLPIAVRSLALFWNKDMFKEAGLDPENPPKTWDQLVADAKKMTKRDSDGKYEQEGFAWNVGGQGLHVIQQVLMRQYGVEPYSEDGKQVQWNDKPEGLEAFKFWMDMTTKDHIGDPTFLETPDTAFKSGRAGMIIDGSFNIAAYKDANAFEWGVTTLPVKEEGGEESNFGSYWTNAITKGVEGKKLEASQKFLKFLISEETQKDWLENVGELPAAASLSENKEITEDPIYGPFVEGLKDAHSTFFVKEDKERDIFLNAVDQILLNGTPVDEAFNKLVEEEQRVRDEYFNE
ncbi:extracellular solute-binding protein [Virgibacillus sp. 179-BFC.A HS]|uniref:Extracellular solute-binding protein n=1 Tax=Tigheibacillus jepli TaxID=3035914 RepID=A0ABU5CF37_9BACI|nr:extracellular solute-binding protein [Virgibacillus sp. 179-BFC.A HS]MDY0404947.1 extracellular solute-binding protein [Virgibacillus sp. 179-BFC.A HS]